MQNCTKVIYFLFITHDLKEFLKQAGEMKRGETNTADHPTPVFDLNGKGALANDFATIYNFGKNHRKLWFSNKKAVLEYV
jgi:hypothetical protein